VKVRDAAIVAHDPHPPPCACCDVISFQFCDDEIHAHVAANSLPRLGACLSSLIRVLVENPSVIPAIVMGATSSRVRRRTR
jgi:hypothetical protein